MQVEDEWKCHCSPSLVRYLARSGSSACDLIFSRYSELPDHPCFHPLCTIIIIVRNIFEHIHLLIGQVLLTVFIFIAHVVVIDRACTRPRLPPNRP